MTFLADEVTEKILELSKRLPEGDLTEHSERFDHCRIFGEMIVLFEDGEIKGFAECYRLDEPPEYPAIPWPVSTISGNYVYCFSAVCEKGFVRKLINLGKSFFRDCEYFCYHRFKRGNKLQIERI